MLINCFLEVDLSQNIVDVDFINFCIVYSSGGLYNILTTSVTGKGNNKKDIKQ